MYSCYISKMNFTWMTVFSVRNFWIRSFISLWRVVPRLISASSLGFSPDKQLEGNYNFKINIIRLERHGKKNIRNSMIKVIMCKIDFYIHCS